MRCRGCAAMFKTCNACKNEFPATKEYFYASKEGALGLYARCKGCVLLAQKRYVENNPEKRKNTTSEYDKRNKQIRSIKAKKYWSENAKRFSDWRKNARASNYEEYLKREQELRDRSKRRISISSKKYRQSEKGIETKRKYYKGERGIRLSLIKYHKRKSITKSLEHSFDLRSWEITKNHFNNKCAYCGNHDKLEQDHFIPLTRNGEYTINNIIPACKSCNSSKNDSDFFEWYNKRDYYSVSREKKILKFLGYTGNVQKLALLI